MKKFKKVIAIVLTLVLTVGFLYGCGRQSDKVSYNVSQDADNFNIVRRVVVINMRTDKVIFEVIGRLSIDNVDEDRLDVIVETDDGVYKKHMINLTNWNMFFVEDIEGAKVDKYQYEVNYMPESLIPFDVIQED